MKVTLAVVLPVLVAVPIVGAPGADAALKMKLSIPCPSLLFRKTILLIVPPMISKR